MDTIHFVLQGKGGVGKSLISSLIFQYLIAKDCDVSGIDTDPVNATLHGYKALNVTKLEIKSGDNGEGNDIDPRKFDTMIELLTNEESEKHYIIDNGAAVFVPLCAYMIENDIFSILTERSRILVHTVITGGQGMRDTLNGLNTLIQNFNIPLVVWLNRYFGEISQNNKSFEQFNIYQENKDKFAALIRIPLKSAQTFGKDLEELFSRHQTFMDALADGSLPLMTRQRLKIWWDDVCGEIDKTNLIAQSSKEE
jgi:MinD superfamily P-loop ATPase